MTLLLASRAPAVPDFDSLLCACSGVASAVGRAQLRRNTVSTSGSGRPHAADDQGAPGGAGLRQNRGIDANSQLTGGSCGRITGGGVK